MTKILKNTTGSNIELQVLGRTINANSSLNVDSADFNLLGLPESILEIVPLLNSGSIVVNDGAQDLSAELGLSLIQASYTKLEENIKENNRVKVDVVGTLSDGSVKVSTNDSTTGFLENKIVSGDNKIAISTINDGGDEDLQIQFQPSNVGTSELNNDANFIDSAGAPVQPGDISNFETTTQLNTRDTNNRNRSNHTGTQLANTISDFSSAVQSAETTTTLSFNNTTKILSYTNEDGTVVNVDLTQFLDDTNLARITSGTLNAGTGIATFTRDDNTTFDVDFSSLNDQAFINAAIATHEQSIDNHDDVDTTTNTPIIGDKLIWDGTNWTPSNDSFKDSEVRTTGLINQTTTLQQYLSLSTNVPVTGNYKICWNYEWSINSTQNDFIGRVQLDNSTDLSNHRQEAKDSGGTGISLPNTGGGNTNTGTNQRHSFSGHTVVNLTSGGHTIDIDFAGELSSLEPAIYRGAITIERWD